MSEILNGMSKLILLCRCLNILFKGFILEMFLNVLFLEPGVDEQISWRR